MLAHDLATHLQAPQPAGVSFEDAVQMVMRLYATVDGLPRSLHGSTSRDHLTDVFASLGASRFSTLPLTLMCLLVRFGRAVVSSVTAPTLWVFDMDRAETVMAPFLGA